MAVAASSRINYTATYIIKLLYVLYTVLLLKTNAIYNLKYTKATFDINSDTFDKVINNIVSGEISIGLETENPPSSPKVHICIMFFVSFWILLM